MDTGFDTTRPGTDEAHWRALLDRTAWQDVPPGCIVLVGPHPDDEVFGAGGLLAAALRRRQRCIVVSVTDGEAARPEQRGLAALRRRELDAALRALGGGDDLLVRLALPDGGVGTTERQLHGRIDALVGAAIAAAAGPVTLIAPFEQDGHPDHDSVGRVCARIARARGSAHWRYLIWGWHRLDPGRFAAASFVRIRLAAPDLAAKRAALHCFPTQTRPARAAAPIVPAHVLRYFERPYEAFLREGFANT